MGYHLSYIPKGKYGDISKIKEEVAELEDAIAQDNPVMALVELSDLIGAIDGYLEKRFGGKIALTDLVTMAQTTRRAWQTGARKEDQTT